MVVGSTRIPTLNEETGVSAYLKQLHIITMGWPTEPSIYKMWVDERGHQGVMGLMLETRMCPCCTRGLKMHKHEVAKGPLLESIHQMEVFHWRCDCDSWWNKFEEIEFEWAKIKDKMFKQPVTECQDTPSQKKSATPLKFSLRQEYMSKDFKSNLIGFLRRECPTVLTNSTWSLLRLAYAVNQKRFQSGSPRMPESATRGFREQTISKLHSEARTRAEVEKLKQELRTLKAGQQNLTNKKLQWR